MPKEGSDVAKDIPDRSGGLRMVAVAGTIAALAIIMALAEDTPGAAVTATDTTAGDITSATTAPAGTSIAATASTACGQLPVAAGGQGVILGNQGRAGPAVRQPAMIVDPRTVPTPSAEERATREAALDLTYRNPCSGSPPTGASANTASPPVAGPPPGSETFPAFPFRNPAAP